MTRVLVLALVFSCGLGACAFNRKQAHHTARPRLEEASAPSTWLALAVHDQRQEVISGEKEPRFVGISRGGYGNPFDVTTESGAPFADDVATSIASGLTAAGFRVTVVPLSHATDPAQAVAKLRAAGASRLLLVRIDRWKTDAYWTTGLDFDVQATVMDDQGAVLGKAVQHGKDAIGGSGSSADAAAVQALETKLELLLNAPKIQGVLQQAPEAVAGAAVPKS